MVSERASLHFTVYVTFKPDREFMVDRLRWSGLLLCICRSGLGDSAALLGVSPLRRKPGRI